MERRDSRESSLKNLCYNLHHALDSNFFLLPAKRPLVAMSLRAWWPRSPPLFFALFRGISERQTAATDRQLQALFGVEPCILSRKLKISVSWQRSWGHMILTQIHYACRNSSRERFPTFSEIMRCLRVSTNFTSFSFYIMGPPRRRVSQTSAVNCLIELCWFHQW